MLAQQRAMLAEQRAMLATYQAQALSEQDKVLKAALLHHGHQVRHIEAYRSVKPFMWWGGAACLSASSCAHPVIKGAGTIGMYQITPLGDGLKC